MPEFEDVRREFRRDLDEYAAELAEVFEANAVPRRRRTRSSMTAAEKAKLIRELGSELYMEIPWS